MYEKTMDLRRVTLVTQAFGVHIFTTPSALVEITLPIAPCRFIIRLLLLLALASSCVLLLLLLDEVSSATPGNGGV